MKEYEEKYHVGELRYIYRPSEGKAYTDIYYNIHLMIQFKEYMWELGYPHVDYIPFEIDLDIPKTDSMDIGIYTVKTEDGKRIQISVGLMMPWYFIVASK